MDQFIEQFETLATAYDLTNNDRFEYVVRYVKRPIHKIIEGLQEHVSKDWNGFNETLRQLFDHIQTKKRFKEKERFRSKSNGVTITIATRGSSLELEDGCIRGRRFGAGIPKVACKKLEERMLQVTPDLD